MKWQSICQTRKRKRLIKNDSRIIWLNNGHILVALVTSIMDGVFDLTSLVYFLTVIGVFLFLTVQSLEKRRWSE